MTIKLVNNIPTEVGMSGVMSDSDYHKMIASPLNNQGRTGDKAAKALFTKVFGAELAKVYCK